MSETIDPQMPPAAGSATDIAIVGMAAHLPGADTIAQYWQNLRDGIESIRHLSKEELLAAGEAPHLLERDDYVAAAAPLDGFKTFDAEFFGFSPKEAAILDPQHRQFLEVSWEALENAGHMPEKFKGPIGVFGGCGMGSYFYFNICSNRDLVDDTGMFLLRHTGNDKDFMVTRLSHVLDLKGPSINIQTACSTSLVATHYACQSLLNGECDMALAGGVTIELPHARGYLYKEGEILSPDGHCHAFDHRAQGTVFGSGAGVVVLRRLEDAIEDGDHIWAVIKGTAVNNDGAAKAGYLAPSVAGQAAAIADAHALSEVTADTIDYVECHGTGTYLGDPIEVAALTQAFRETTADTGYCRIGSVKTNIGHLDTAAGVASLIKASLGLHHRQMPPSLGFEAPNPAIDFDNSPFRVNDRLSDWPADRGPRRAGVNSLGVGGTNAHAVLQEAPARAPSEESDFPFQILTISGRNKSALEANSANLAAHLRAHPDQPLADVAWTLKEGRRAFERRRVVVAETHEDAAALLEANDPRRVFTHSVVGDAPEVVFMFPGGGAQYAGMARDLYEVEPVFAEWMDRGLDCLQAKIDYDIRALWLPEPGEEDAADQRLKTPSVQLPLIMIVEYALAQLWISWGVKPAALVGHSMGENTAACLAGVMTFEECIGLVHLRGRLFDTVPAGGMLSVSLPADDLRPLLGDDLDLAGVNAPTLSVATGPQAALDRLEAQLRKLDVDVQRIPIDIAAHSRMLDPILAEFRSYLASLSLQPPQIPFTSNRTGAYITAAEATDPDYWVGHLRNTVLFADCIATLAADRARVFLEVGPGKALTSLAGQHPDVSPNQVISTLRHPQDDVADDSYFAAMLGRLWAVGVEFDWPQFWGEARRNRVVLPTYAFQRQEYFIEAASPSTAPENTWLMRNEDISQWAYRPAWKARYADCLIDVSGDLRDSPAESWLIFEDASGYGAEISKRLRMAGHQVTSVRPGDGFARVEGGYLLAPEHGRTGYDQLLQDLATNGNLPSRVLHLWLMTEDEKCRPGSSFFHRNQEYGFYALLFLSQALNEQGVENLHMTVVTSDAAQLRDEPLAYPEKATVMGPARVIPREFPGITCAVLDVALRQKPKGRDREALLHHLLEEALSTPATLVALLRGDKRYEQEVAPCRFDPVEEAPLRPEGTYLITGGFGGIGTTLAAALIERSGANIVLLSRSELPDRASWDNYLQKHAPQDAISRRIRTVQELESKGGQVLVLAADVSNVEDMRLALRRAREAFGDVHGVIHAAGVIADAPILGKSLSDIEDVFTPKIHGTQVLDALFPDGSLDWMVLFSSSSTLTAPAGQVDYVAANEYLNAFAKARSAGKTRYLALDWGIWSEVGMAADAMASRLGRQEASEAKPADQPLLQQMHFDAKGARVFSGHLSTQKWVLDEHRTKAGHILLPGTGYLELIHEALRAQGESGAYELRDLFFLAPLQVEQDRGRDLRLRLPRSDEGYEVSIESALPGSDAFGVNAEAAIALLPLAQPEKLDLAAISLRCGQPHVAPEASALRSAQEAHLNFGPRWQVLRSTAFGAEEGLAKLRLPDAFTGDLGHYALHPGLLDLATGWAMELIKGYRGEHLWAPVSYHRVRVFGPLQRDIISWVRSAADNTAAGPTASFDVTLCDPDGTVLLEIEDFSIRKLEGRLDGALSQSQPREGDGEAQHRPLSAAEERLQHNLSQGIRASEGAEAFFRALGAGQSQIVVSSLDLPALIAQAGEAEVQSGQGQTFQRPDLDQDYAAPESEVEKRLAGFFQDLLGVEEVGIDDGFFDLGGHSLIAVRLFAKIKKAFGVDFPISLLFEAPTIRKIAAQIPQQGSNAPTENVVPLKPQRRFTHAVPMHQGEGGFKTPFFLVAGMFGNVLNLRHLAHLLGDERPFYGMQARGLFGDASPHDTIEAAARDYIAEIRQLQPQGPYMIGGFSGGGITAYEIARQLKASGEEVSVLVMLDTPLPQRRALSRRDRAMIQWLELKEKGPGYPFRWAMNRIRWEIAKRRQPAQTGDTPAQFHNAEIEAAFLGAVSRYEVQPWDGALTLYRPPLQGRWQVAPDRLVNSERAYVLHDNDWTQHAPAVEVFEVPGDHDSMVLEPNVRVLAARMRDVIRSAEARTGKPRKKAAE